MTRSCGIDVGTGMVKVVVARSGDGAAGGTEGVEILARAGARLRKRDVHTVVEETFQAAARESGLGELDYIATTGEGEDVAMATGHFYGMTTHARGGLMLRPDARAVLDLGALHSRAILMDERGKVLNYKMTSQCASGSGQFLENIARYLGVSLGEVGALSLQASEPEKVSSICAVLAETDVINMVSRGISTANILRGIHESMAGRLATLLRSLGARGTVLVTGGLAADDGLLGALRDALARERGLMMAPVIVNHADSLYAGAIGAALWGAFRHRKLNLRGAAWAA